MALQLARTALHSVILFGFSNLPHWHGTRCLDGVHEVSGLFGADDASGVHVADGLEELWLHVLHAEASSGCGSFDERIGVPQVALGAAHCACDRSCTELSAEAVELACAGVEVDSGATLLLSIVPLPDLVTEDGVLVSLWIELGFLGLLLLIS